MWRFLAARFKSWPISYQTCRLVLSRKCYSEFIRWILMNDARLCMWKLVTILLRQGQSNGAMNRNSKNNRGGL